MRYNREMIIKDYEEKQRQKFIFFWGAEEKAQQITKACLSQWYPCCFKAEDQEYYTTEQYMMAQKALLFEDKEMFRQIMKAEHPKQFKTLGRKIRGFQEEVWKEHRMDIVVAGNYAKFSQNPELKNFLLASKERILVEASPYDKIWGIGMTGDSPNVENPLTWKGTNLLGFALMEVRDILQEEKEEI
ncbi:MAG: NADAR family protein [Lachnospiraceae bacterium]|nr:NADAR family protein [Lachnospiraceae bacterium]